MNRVRVTRRSSEPRARRCSLVGGSATLAIVAALVASAWATGDTNTRTNTSGSVGQRAELGLAGPLGPDAFSAVPSYFKSVTFSSNQLGQYQDIAAELPVGEYLVHIDARSAAGGTGPDCMGVSFPLAQAVSKVDLAGGFRGYVSVTRTGAATTVSCYSPATTSASTATYDVFYTPLAPNSGADNPEEHS